VSLRLHSNLLYQKFVMMANRTRGARGGLKLSRTLHEAPPPPRFTRQPQKEKKFLAFRVCARPIFSEKGKDIFLFGVLPSKYSGSVAGLQFGLGFAKTIFWGKGFGKTSADFPRGGGVWGGIRAGFVFRFRWTRGYLLL